MRPGGSWVLAIGVRGVRGGGEGGRSAHQRARRQDRSGDLHLQRELLGGL